MKPAFVLAALLLAGGPEDKPRFHGERTELRKALARVTASEICEAETWTYASVAVYVLKFPRKMGDTAAGRKQEGVGGVPWRPVAIGAFTLPKDPAVRKTIQGGRHLLVFRAEDRKTCLLNDLDGRRIFDQHLEDQDATAIELDCTKVPEALEKLSVPLKINSEVSSFLLIDSKPPDGGRIPSAGHSESPRQSTPNKDLRQEVEGDSVDAGPPR